MKLTPRIAARAAVLATVLAASFTLAPMSGEAQQRGLHLFEYSCGTSLVRSTALRSNINGAQIGTVYLYYNSCRNTVWGSIDNGDPAGTLHDYVCVQSFSGGSSSTNTCGFGAHYDAPEVHYVAGTSYAYGTMIDSTLLVSAQTSPNY